MTIDFFALRKGDGNPGLSLEQKAQRKKNNKTRKKKKKKKKKEAPPQKKWNGMGVGEEEPIKKSLEQNG